MVTVFLFAFNYEVLAQSGNDVMWGGYEDEVEQDSGLSRGDPRIIIAKVIRVFLGFLGILAVILIMFAGFMYMTSDGEESKVQRAKDILKNALIGLIIIMASFGIVSFLLGMFGDGGSGGGNPYGGRPGVIPGGTAAIGNCTIESVYPAHNQRNTPRNTSIIVTFREEVDPTTICQDGGDGSCDFGDNITGAVNIFYTSDSDECVRSFSSCPTRVENASVVSADNRTFVIIPEDYLGSPSEFIDYTVYLTNSILKLSDSTGIFSSCRSDFFSWDFEVSNRIDLTPPQVEGVFPAPDSGFDSVVTGNPIQANGSISIMNQPNIFESASVTLGGATGITLSDINVNHLVDGTLRIAIQSDGEQALLQNINDDSLLGSAEISGEYIEFEELFSFSKNNSEPFVSGESWEVVATPRQESDNLRIGNMTYTFVSGLPTRSFQITRGLDTSETAANIAEIINNGNIFTPINSSASATVNGSRIDLQANLAGVEGNEINMSGDLGFSITPMSGGSNDGDMVTVNGVPDQPMNTAIQINFNEAMMPIMVSGRAEDLRDYIRIVNAGDSPGAEGETCGVDADCLSFRCTEGVCSGSNTYLEGEFFISNQYKTVEFVSDNQCGVNACGEAVYCLPADSHLRVEFMASNLFACSNNNDCASRSPFNNCNTNCQDADGNNHPTSDITGDPAFTGIMDAALNSLDGNRNDNAEGQVSFYNENTPNIGNGDNYTWLFYISGELDLTSPEIENVSPIHQSTTTLEDPISVSFSKVMLSSSLKTGGKEIVLGDQRALHKGANIWSPASYAVGYWVTKSDVLQSGYPISTIMNIEHTPFSDATSYRAQAGSALRDIYQNCYKPGVGPGCPVGVVDMSNPSCCAGVPTGPLNNGNCP